MERGTARISTAKGTPSAEDPKAHFVSTVMRILGHIQTATLTATQHEEKPSDVPAEEDKAAYRQVIEEMATKLAEGLDASGE
jgi:hypothetical protein